MTVQLKDGRELEYFQKIEATKKMLSNMKTEYCALVGDDCYEV